jgi:hypothetical protein
MWTNADVDHCKVYELSVKTLATIQEETAYTWGVRAMAAYELWLSTVDDKILADALEYRHESLEHAALAGPQVYLKVYAALAVLEAYL